MTKIKAFLRKWWFVIAGALVVAILLLRRGLVMRKLSELRAKLQRSTAALEDLRYQQDVAAGTDAIAQHQAAAERLEHDIQHTQQAIEDLQAEFSATNDKIDAARSWKDLEELRNEGNKR